jgi:hypothetical protein
MDFAFSRNFKLIPMVAAPAKGKERNATTFSNLNFENDEN